MNFEHITDWVFDLDNTLYPRHCDLFAQVDWKMTDYVANVTGKPKEEARVLQKFLYREHGTTLRGLMNEYNVDPFDFLAQVHDIDYSKVEHNPRLGELIAKLPGKKHIFTNGDVAHAENTLKAIGITHEFDSMFDIVAADFWPKPQRKPYDLFLSQHISDPNKAIMFEDMPRNLAVPKEHGMATVLIVPQSDKTHNAESWELEVDTDDHIDHVTDHIDGFIETVLESLGAGPTS